MRAVEQFHTFAKVASMALGGGGDEDKTPENILDASAQFSALMGG